jgi:hypothetical protein
MSSNSQSNKGLLEDLVRVIKNYIEKPILGEKDYGKSIRSERFLKQCMDFDATDTKLSDVVMSGGYALLGIEIYLNLLLSAKEDYYSGANIGSVLSAFDR